MGKVAMRAKLDGSFDDARRSWPPQIKCVEIGRCVAVLGLGALGGCQPGVLDPQGMVGHAEKTILIDCLIIMLAIVVPTILATFAFAWWFRSSNPKARHMPNWAYSGSVELVTWSIPVLVIILLGGVSWIASHDLDPATPLASDKPPLEIQVVSLDWKWLFIYPGQHVASVNQLVVPAGVPLNFSLTSASVMNTFFVPQLGSMIYTMNHMTSRLNLMADQPGTYRGQSSHYSGDGFSDMHFDVTALSAEQFASWATATRNAGPTLDSGAYSELAKQSMKVAPFTYGQVDPALFQKITTQELPPGPGPYSSRLDPKASQRAEH